MSIPFKQAFLYWLKLGFINFGGPTGQIAIMHTDLVDKRKWISEQRFLHALNYCMLLPGPEAQQLATYIGWLMHGIVGGIIAGSFFVLPSVAVLLILSWIYVTFGNVPAIAGIFYGVKPVVIAIVVFATYRIAKRAIRNPAHLALAAGAFVGIFFLQVPFPLIVLGAGVLGWVISRWDVQAHGSGGASETDAFSAQPHTAPSRARVLKLIGAFLMLWLVPLALLLSWRDSNSVFVQEYVFFTQAAFVTFGGAYAVLTYVAQIAVNQFGWLTWTQMIDGLALAESTPGPLIMVLQFVGYLGAWKFHGDLDPTLSGSIGALLSTYVTFLPSFFFIFLGAPYIEKLRGNVRLNSALSGITAAVVGVILNLAVFLGLNVLFPNAQLDVVAALAAFGAFIALWRFKWEFALVVAVGGSLGLLRSLIL